MSIQKKQIVNYYNDYTDRQALVGINERHKMIMSFLLEKGLKRNHNVLEVGCGIGTQSQLIANYLSKGTLLSGDISDKSIELAKTRLKKYTNIQFFVGDISEQIINRKFDVIILPDVIEHIPLEQHHQLFKTLSSLLNEDGFIFINIPEPYYLEWCNANEKEMLQIIDQPIFLSELEKNTRINNLRICNVESYSLWIEENDYQMIFIKKQSKSFKAVEQKITLWDKIRHKILNFRKNKKQ